MKVTGKYGQVYSYLVYRHPDGRRRTPKKCTIKAPILLSHPAEEEAPILANKQTPRTQGKADAD